MKINTMSTFKKAKVVMLPTNKPSKLGDLATYQGKSLAKVIKEGVNLKNTTVQFWNLYIISDDEIKEGDWCYDKRPDENGDLVDIVYQVKNIEFELRTSTEKKIIATTDTSLYTHQKETVSLPERVFYLPQPSQQFIQKFVEEYNKGNVITDVLVEYENKFDGKEYVDELDAYGYDKIKSILKINHKDNNIIIKIAKDSWSREEVIEFGNKVKEYCKNGWKLDSLHRVFFEWDKWIEENL